MSYSGFTLDSVCRAFSLKLEEREGLFQGIPTATVSPQLRAILDENLPLATTIQTEKARSELIIAPILVEVRRLMKHRISFFSGVEFNVDLGRGLNGTCDYVLSGSPIQFMIRCPVMMIVEAKNENIKTGLGQCVAEMVAARLFNESEGEGQSTIHGAVTSGSAWTFLKLDGATVCIDRIAYSIEPVEVVLSILLHCVGGDPATAGAAA
jgi:hypothetical protein